MLYTTKGTPITLENLTETLIASEYNLDAVVDYRKMKSVRAVKALRVECEKVNKRLENIEILNKRISAIKLKRVA